MLVSAMDNIIDEKNTNGNSSRESNSVDVSHELKSGDFRLENQSAGNESQEQESISDQSSSPLSDIISEIDMTEIKFLKAIGKGSFGVVHKAIWAGKTVAVKKVETDTEVTAFFNEIKQLSRVRHENIIQMYGTGTSVHAKCIIMEFAHDGSLYQFLHCHPRSKYNLSHALSWLLQCAKAIAYLHSIEPRAIIHRDLKPLNMLLTNGKKVLKICDFGTACDLRSVMTDNKGSTAWMAPEVIKGTNYNEKCDVYSWGIILWELLTRRIPFEELGQPFRILWQVVNKARPPLIQGCPRPIERLMKRCWLDEQANRPSMQEVVDAIYPLYKIMSGEDEFLSYFSSSGESYTESCHSPLNGESNGEHTSQDVSEFTTSSTTTPDPPGYSKGPRPYPSPPQDNGELQDAAHRLSPVEGLPSSPQGRISPNVSASVVVGVENLLPPWGSAKSDEGPAPITRSPVPSRSPAPPRSPIHPRSPCPGVRRTPFVTPPEMLTPLSISIPNEGPAERNDVVVVPQQGGYPGPSGPMLPNQGIYSPWVFPPASSPSSRVGITPQLAVSPPHVVSPPLTSVVTTLTFTPPTTAPPGVERSPGAQGVAMRHNLQAQDPTAVLRRRSAEVPHGVRVTSTSNPKGHRRSSSYESSQLIGFEPLADQVQKEAHRAARTHRSISDGVQRVKDKFPFEYGYLGGNRISEEVGQSFRSSVDEHGGTQPSPPTGSSFLQGSFPAGAITPTRPAPLPPDHVIHTRRTGNFSRGSSVPTSLGLGIATTLSGAAHATQGTPQDSTVLHSETTESDELGGAFWQLLDDDLKPAMPQPSCPQSQQIYKEHKGLAHKLLVVQEEIVYLDQEKNRLLTKLDEQEREQVACKNRYNDKIIQLKSKQESLSRHHSRLSEQLREIQSRQQTKEKGIANNPDPNAHKPQQGSLICHPLTQVSPSHPHPHGFPYHPHGTQNFPQPRQQGTQNFPSPQSPYYPHQNLPGQSSHYPRMAQTQSQHLPRCYDQSPQHHLLYPGMHNQ